MAPPPRPLDRLPPPPRSSTCWWAPATCSTRRRLPSPQLLGQGRAHRRRQRHLQGPHPCPSGSGQKRRNGWPCTGLLARPVPAPSTAVDSLRSCARGGRGRASVPASTGCAACRRAACPEHTVAPLARGHVLHDDPRPRAGGGSDGARRAIERGTVERHRQGPHGAGEVVGRKKHRDGHHRVAPRRRDAAVDSQHADKVAWQTNDVKQVQLRSGRLRDAPEVSTPAARKRPIHTVSQEGCSTPAEEPSIERRCASGIVGYSRRCCRAEHGAHRARPHLPKKLAIFKENMRAAPAAPPPPPLDFPPPPSRLPNPPPGPSSRSTRWPRRSSRTSVRPPRRCRSRPPPSLQRLDKTGRCLPRPARLGRSLRNLGEPGLY